MTPGLKVPLEPDLTAVPFRYLPERGDPDAFNRRLLARINDSKRSLPGPFGQLTTPGSVWRPNRSRAAARPGNEFANVSPKTDPMDC
ncbi:hypothetical protein [Streptomyces sp. MspMP-M5]|uniref:hypothetical protein n=1 Tax=Streptomyces sp. MspMP-M5 TaxID=1155718 RepID=UPI001319C6EE|nr:hypothetical protein [Streptomyces sp. MspMP-M5]MYT30110.1 hypothetical protein [Streptomyces sp. SID8354]